MKIHSFLKMIKNTTFWSFLGVDILVINSILIVLYSLFHNHLSYNSIKLGLEMQLKCRLSAL